jgi:hypothetical protein
VLMAVGTFSHPDSRSVCPAYRKRREGSIYISVSSVSSAIQCAACWYMHLDRHRYKELRCVFLQVLCVKRDNLPESCNFV